MLQFQKKRSKNTVINVKFPNLLRDKNGKIIPKQARYLRVRYALDSDDINTPTKTARSGQTDDYPIQVKLGLNATFNAILDKGLYITTNKNKKFLVGNHDLNLLMSEEYDREIVVDNLTKTNQPKIQIEYSSTNGELLKDKDIELYSYDKISKVRTKITGRTATLEQISKLKPIETPSNDQNQNAGNSDKIQEKDKILKEPAVATENAYIITITGNGKAGDKDEYAIKMNNLDVDGQKLKSRKHNCCNSRKSCCRKSINLEVYGQSIC